MEGLDNYSYNLNSLEKILATHCIWRFSQFDYIIKPYLEVKQDLEKYENYFLSDANVKEFDDAFYFKVGKDYYALGEYQKASKCFLFSAQKNGKFQADAYFALGCIKILNNEKPVDEFSIAYNLYGEKIAERHMPSYMLLNMLLKGEKYTYQSQDSITFSGLKVMDQIVRFGVKEQRASLMQLDMRFEEVRSFLKNEFRYIILEKETDGEVEIEATTIKITPENPKNEYDNECIGIITRANLKGFGRDELMLSLSNLSKRLLGK